MKIKVLIPALHYPPIIGGFEIFTKNICDRLKKDSDREIFLVTGKVRGQPRVQHDENLHLFRNSSLYTLNDFSYSSYIYILTMLPILFFRCWYYILKYKIDVLHAQGFFSGILCLLLHIVTRRPYVLTIQAADFTIYHSEIKFNFLIRFQAAVERLLYKHAKICHGVSHDLVRHFARQGRKDAFMIPNGVETNLFQPISEEKKGEMRKKMGIETKYLVSCVSRLQEKNGTHDLILAVAEIIKHRDDVSAIIIGDGVERKRLENLITEHHLEKRVFLLGDILHDEVSPYVAASDVFVRPSLAEGFGIVFLEAMACGVPAVGTPVGGIVDFLHDEQTGLMAKVSDAKDLAQKIEMILDNPAFAQRLVAASNQMIAETYTWDAIAKNINALYAQSITSRRLLIATGIFPPDIGGPATYTSLLQKELPKRGVEVKVVTYGPAGISRSIPKGIRHLLYFFACLYRGWNVDAIFSQDPVSAGLPAFFAAKILRKKFLIRAVGDHAWEQSVQRFGVKETIDDFQHRKYGFAVTALRTVQSFVATGADAIITPSHYFKTVVANWIKDSADKIHVIYNGIDLPPQDILQAQNPLPRTIVTVGRLVPWKGFDVLIDMVKDMPEWNLIIVGDGPDLDMLNKKIQEYKLEKWVTLKPSVTRPELMDIFRSSGVFVLNTSFESFSFALVEAMSVGLPIITTNIGNLSEIVTHEKNAILVAPNDIPAMKEALSQLEKNPDMALSLRKNAVERAQNFSIDNTLNNLMKLLTSLSSKK